MSKELIQNVEKDTIKILQIDGGGIKGIIPAYLLQIIEKQLNKPIYEIFDLIVGTSVGSIIGGCFAAGKIPADMLFPLMKTIIPEVFKLRWFRNYLVDPRYDRKLLVKMLQDKTSNIVMAECKTNFMCTSVSLCDGTTHYFKSWEQKDGQMFLTDAINYSYAAPFFFGAMNDEQRNQVWVDGGTGNANCPLSETIVECLRQGWIKNKKVHILSLGCGYSDMTVSYQKAISFEVINQIMFYMDPVDGGLAKKQSIATEVSIAKSIMETIDNFSINRIDTIIDKKTDKLDGIKYMGYYEEKAKQIVNQIDFSKLK